MSSGAAAALLQNDTVMISVANRVIAVGYITLSLAGEARKRADSARVKYWEIIADNFGTDLGHAPQRPVMQKAVA